MVSCNCGQRLRRSVSSNWSAFSTCGWINSRILLFEISLEFLLPLRFPEDQAARCARKKDCARAIVAPRFRSADRPALSRAENRRPAATFVLFVRPGSPPTRARCASSRTIVSRILRTRVALSARITVAVWQVGEELRQTVLRFIYHLADLLFERRETALVPKSLFIDTGRAGEKCFSAGDRERSAGRSQVSA